MTYWFTIAATLWSFASILGFTTGGMFTDHYGKRMTVFGFNLLQSVCWVISAKATTKWLLFVSYSLQGLFGSIAYNCVGEMNITLSTLLIVELELNVNLQESSSQRLHMHQ